MAQEQQQQQQQQQQRHRRKLRVLVITMGGPRQEAMERMFAQHQDDFDPPTFSPGIPSRSLRTRSEFFKIANDAGLIPAAEWTALQEAFQNPHLHEENPQRLFEECLKTVPIVGNDDSTERMGNDADLQVHYSVELWRKSKALNRGRSVLACMLAHLLAMKRLVTAANTAEAGRNRDDNDEDSVNSSSRSGGFDLIVEDNVRLCHNAAERIWQVKEASEESRDEDECHLRYYGWLGSRPNLEWVLNVHSRRQGLQDAKDKAFYFPIPQDFDDAEAEPTLHEDNKLKEDEVPSQNQDPSPTTISGAHTTPGGTAIWGSYAYWISKEGYEALLDRLRRDVGAMLWKGKRMRAYVVKPIDKVMPRLVMSSSSGYSRRAVHVSRQPAFFRAPMLTSKIHAQWDPDFCKSTAYQLSQTNLSWDDLALTDTERKIVQHAEATGEWLTMAQMAEREKEETKELESR